jgi:hypothetical protein
MFNAIAPSHCTACGGAHAPGAAFCSSCGRQCTTAITVQVTTKKTSPIVKLFALVGIVGIGLVLIGMVGGTSAPRSGIAGPAAGGAQPIHQIGDTIHVGYWTYRVNGYRWTPYIGDGFLGQKADAEYMIVDLSIRNDDRTESTLPSIVLVDDQGREFEQSSHSFLLRNSFSLLKQLNPTVESRGTLLFDIPPGEYTIRLSGGFRSSDNALVQLREIDPAPKQPASAPGQGVRPTVPSTYQLQQAARAAAGSRGSTAEDTDDQTGGPSAEEVPSSPVQPN